MSYQQEKFTAIADNIRTCLGTDEKIKPSKFADKIPEVFETGKKAQYDEFWDAYQQNGSKANYVYAFAQWNKNTFQPKYNMNPTSASYMFYGFNQDISVESLPELLKNNNVNIDFSKCTTSQYLGSYSYISDFGFIDCSSANNLNHMFNMASRLNTVSLKLKNDGSQSFTNTFDACTRLADITIEGVIGQNISFSSSASLSQDSIISIISALSDTSTGKTVIFSKNAVNNAFETSEGAADGNTSSEWTTLIATKSNWTISLV